jgi:quinol monooxygenase YgiN
MESLIAPVKHNGPGDNISAPGGTLDDRHKDTTTPVTVILELTLKPASVPAARAVMRRALQDTRAFDGNLGTDVLVDEDDEAHWVIYERWNTVEHDEAYRSFRAGEGRLTGLPALLAAPPSRRTALPTSDRQGHPPGRATKFRLEPSPRRRVAPQSPVMRQP